MMKNMMFGIMGFIVVVLAALAQAQTVWTNNGTGLWGDNTKWVGGAVPSTGGSETYTMVLTNGSTASARTNNIGNPDFLLSQLILTNAANGVIIYGGNGTNLVFTNNATVMPRVVQGAAQTLTINHNITLATNLIFEGTGMGAVTVNSNITGSAGLSFSTSGSCTSTLSGANTFSGDITVNSGRLILKNQANLYSNSFMRTLSVASGAFLQFGAAINIGGINSPGTTLAGNGTLEINPSSGKTVALGVTTNNYVKLAMTGGLIDVQSGVFRNGPNQGQDWKDNKASLSINAGAECQPWDGGNMYIDELDGSGTLGGSQSIPGTGKFLTLGVNNGSGIFSGTITNMARTIFKTGTGTQTFTGTNSYAGVTTISNGFIAVGNNQALSTNVVNLYGGGLAAASGSWAITNVVNIKNNATFDTDVNSLTMVGPITNSGALTKIGAGKLTLAGTNTYRGVTTVSNGVLVVNGSTTNSAISVLPNAMLCGSGMAGAVTIAGGAFISGADTNSMGMLTVTNLALAENSTCIWNYSDTAQDLINVTGLLTLPTVATVSVSRVSSSVRLPSFAVLFTAPGLTDGFLPGWVVKGDGVHSDSHVVVRGNQVVVVTSYGTLISVR